MPIAGRLRAWIDRLRSQGLGAAVEAWEGIAGSLGRAVGLEDPPVDARHLAAVCGLRLRPWGLHAAGLLRDVIYYNPADPPRRIQATVGHEVGHFALGWGGEGDSEEGAQYVAQALLLPRRAFDRDLRRTWNVLELQAKHVNAPAEWIARRIVHLRDACATVIDNGRVSTRLVSPWLPPKAQRISKWERALADAALERGAAVQGDSFVWAVPVVEGTWRRVVIVAESRQLSLRL